MMTIDVDCEATRVRLRLIMRWSTDRIYHISVFSIYIVAMQLIARREHEKCLPMEQMPDPPWMNTALSLPFRKENIAPKFGLRLVRSGSAIRQFLHRAYPYLTSSPHFVSQTRTLLFIQGI